MREISILVIDDEENIRKNLKDILEDESYTVYTASEWEEAKKILYSSKVDIVLLDIWLPNIGGMDILKILRSEFIGVQVIMISGHGNIDLAVKSIKMGAFDFIEKPFTSIDKILNTIDNALKMKSLQEESGELKSSHIQKYDIIGKSESILNIKKQILSMSDSTARVLITGENGTGKELIARYIHLNSQRKNKQFIEINCAAIPETLIESELFGYEKGAFTGADNMKKGKFEAADGGTIFLDEIADMSLATQAKVLRVLQEMVLVRVGGNKQIKVDVRVVSATNKDIKQLIKENLFREDLYYRINVVPITLPSLRERIDDIPLLIDHFLEICSAELGKKKKTISSDAMKMLQHFPWQGNIRELKNVIERLSILVYDDVITESDIERMGPEEIDINNSIGLVNEQIDNENTLKEAKEAFEKQYIEEMLKKYDMNITKTAQVLKMERTYLHKKIKSYNIQITK